MRALNIAATGMNAQRSSIEIIANNVANLNTTAYKRQRAAFTDLLYEDKRTVGSLTSEAGSIHPTGVQMGLGVRLAGAGRVHTQGSMELTDNPLDLAIQGNGYFSITLPNGDTAYTRDGTFSLSPEGTIVTADGFELQPGIAVPENTREIVISATGNVQAYVNDDQAATELGQIALTTFVNEAGLSAIGDNLFLESPASGAPNEALPGGPGFGTLRQRYLETGNVNAVTEITDMIEAQRAYEMNSKVVETADQMSSTVTRMR